MKSEETNEIKKFLIVLAIILVFLGGTFIFTRVFVTKETVKEEKEPAVGQINYNAAIVGNMLNKPEKEYYVFVYNQESTDAGLYETINYVSTYLAGEDSEPLKFYNVDLNDHLNQQYKVGEDEETNPKAKTVEDFLFGDYTIVKVKNGKVTKYLETAESIKKEFGIK